ncbi:MAG: YCF48-related protein [Spirosomaceae bacterium]|nr:YCF48-related protein [Spirosomataceae bacterium]
MIHGILQFFDKLAKNTTSRYSDLQSLRQNVPNPTAQDLKSSMILILFFMNANAQWIKQNSNTDASFRSIQAISDKTVWAGGTKGTILKTEDGGQKWQVLKIAGAENLDFRDIQVLDKKTVIAMSAGDGGATWQVVFETTEKGTFFDSIDFWNKKEGLLIGDPIDNKPFILKTTDGGLTWNRISKDRLPDIQDAEASFAASGTCVITKGKSAWICTQKRVFFTHDKGETWNVTETKFTKGQTLGIFGLHFVNEKTGFAVGGDYKNDKQAIDNVAVTNDSGKSWEMLTPTKPDGLKEASWLVNGKTLITVGTSGTGISKDMGKSWEVFDTQPFHAISCYKNTCWTIGGRGSVAKATF